MNIAKFSMGIGDRFALQGQAQLQAFLDAAQAGVQISPVWNKSNREHQIVGTKPASVRQEADAATKAMNFNAPYHVDADHIGLKTVDGFIADSDFFTLDVADFTGKPASEDAIRRFVDQCKSLVGTLKIPGVAQPLTVTAQTIETVARKYLLAVQEAGKIYRHVEQIKGAGTFITEVSMDETDQPQTPQEMLFILKAIALEGIPAQTVAPKFTGRFNKGVDYVGNITQFALEFDQHLAVIAYAVKEFGLPANLKLSVHSGSDKYSLYPIMRQAMRKHNAGLHLKTAGTNWLAELIGLALAGPEGLQIGKDVYAQALARFDEMCGPYATVVDIDKAKLPTPAQVQGWTAQQFASALRHDQNNPQYNLHVRQLLHVGYKVAAEMGERYLSAVKAARQATGEEVRSNIDRHIRALFL